VTTQRGKLTARRLVIGFVPTTGRTLENDPKSSARSTAQRGTPPCRAESRDGTDAGGRPAQASIDRISARSGVSKATIYKWWPNRTAVAIDAFLHQMMADAPVPDTGSAAEDFRLTLRGMMRFYTSPLGAIFAQLIGESQFYPTERERIRTHQVNVRRAAVRKIWDRGVARGELDPNVDPEVALDLIFGPAMYRRATGHGGLKPADADAIVATAMRALAR
jgi:AcrR family transcriptional regulator